MASADRGGLLKIFSKMGISTLLSYRGAQVFEAIGLSRAVIDVLPGHAQPDRGHRPGGHRPSRCNASRWRIPGTPGPELP